MTLITNLNGMNILSGASTKRNENLKIQKEIKPNSNESKSDKLRLNLKNKVESKQKIQNKEEAEDIKNKLKNTIEKNKDLLVAIQGNNITPNQVANLV